MKNKNGFTLVEILAVVAILAILATAAGMAVVSIMQRQRQRLAYTAEQNIAEAALSFYASKNNKFIKACTSEDGSYVIINQKNVEDANKYLRETKYSGISGEQLYNEMKLYSAYLNGEPSQKYELSEYINVSNYSCYNTVTVGELMEKGLINDPDGMCNKSSLVFIYRRTDAKNTAGVLDSVQEEGICKSDRRQERGPAITISPFADLSFSTDKKVTITIITEATNLKPSFTMSYALSNNNTKKPKDSEWKTLEFTGNEAKKARASIDLGNLNNIKYLWIKSDGEIDDEKNKISTTIAGPYAFIPTPEVTYKLNGGSSGTCPTSKKVVFSRPYGENVAGEPEPLCEPTRTGYIFNGWLYADTSTIITDDSIVNDKNNHDLNASWEGKTYTINLNNNGATTNATPSAMSIKYDQSDLQYSTYTAPSRTYKISGFGVSDARKSTGATISSTADIFSDYGFNGWYTNSVDGKKIITNSATPALIADVSGYTNSSGNWIGIGDVTFHAQWEPASITLPTITKTGYTCGWSTSASATTISYASGASITPSSNMVLYGVCVPCTYTLVYNKNNESATGTMANTTCTYDSDCTIRTNAYSLNGYTFNGWNTMSNKSGTNYANAATVKNLTSTCGATINLYANWCPNCQAVSNGTCDLDVNTAGTCKYTTTCDTYYEPSVGTENTNAPDCNAIDHVIRLTYKYSGDLKKINPNNVDSFRECTVSGNASCKINMPTINNFGDKVSRCNGSSYNKLFDFVWKKSGTVITGNKITISADTTINASMSPKASYKNSNNALQLYEWTCGHPNKTCVGGVDDCNSLYRIYNSDSQTITLDLKRAINEKSYIKWDGTWVYVGGELYLRSIGVGSNACHNDTPEITTCATNYQPAGKYRWN